MVSAKKPAWVILTLSGLGWGAVFGAVVGELIGSLFGILSLMDGSYEGLGLIVFGLFIGGMLGTLIGLYAGVVAAMAFTILEPVCRTKRGAAIGTVITVMAALVLTPTAFGGFDIWFGVVFPLLALFPLIRVVRAAAGIAPSKLSLA